jgi:hypothetical protein
MAQQDQPPLANEPDPADEAGGVAPSRRDDAAPAKDSDLDEAFFAEPDEAKVWDDDFEAEASGVERIIAASAARIEAQDNESPEGEAETPAAPLRDEAPAAPPPPAAEDEADSSKPSNVTAPDFSEAESDEDESAGEDHTPAAPLAAESAPARGVVSVDDGEGSEEGAAAQDENEPDESEAEKTEPVEIAAAAQEPVDDEEGGAPAFKAESAEQPDADVEDESVTTAVSAYEEAPAEDEGDAVVLTEKEAPDSSPTAEDAPDEAVFAPPPVAAPPAAAPVKSPPPRRKRSAIGTIAFYLALLALALTGGGIAAVKYKDKDERLRVVADFIEGAARDPQGALRAVKERVAAILPRGEDAPAPQASAPPEPEAPVEVGAVETPPPASDAAPPPKQVAEQTAPEPEPPKPAAAPTPAPVAADADAARRDRAIEELTKRVGDIESVLLELRSAADDAKAAAAKASEAAERAASKPAGAAAGTDAVAFAEGRIDQLAAEIKALREKLDSPKSETRAAPEVDAARPAPSAAANKAAQIVVVAEALLRELDHGRPYAAEHAALTTLGADPKLLASLAPWAESGARTPAQLARDFVPLARRLRALESKADAPIADQLLAGASKLIKVRPAGEPPPPEAPADAVAKIETALAHGDLAAAGEAFAKLPDRAKAEAKSFAAALEGRREAEKAAEALLAGAIASLGQGETGQGRN